MFNDSNTTLSRSSFLLSRYSSPTLASLIQGSRQHEGPHFLPPARIPLHGERCIRFSSPLSSILRSQGLAQRSQAVVKIRVRAHRSLDQLENWPEAESLRRARETSLRRCQELQTSSTPPR